MLAVVAVVTAAAAFVATAGTPETFVAPGVVRSGTTCTATVVDVAGFGESLAKALRT